MTIVLNGSTGLSGVAGSASTPALIGSDADSGYYINSANEPNASVNGTATWSAASTFGFKNRIINGAMVIDQRNAGSAVTVNTAGAFYATDRFRLSGASTSGVFTGQQVSDAPAGFVNSLKVTVTTSAASNDYYIVQPIEGNNIADLDFGKSTAKTVTLSFWVKSSLTGTFSGSLVNNAVDRSYAFTYTISSANTWEKKSVTIPGDTSGTWLTTNGTGIRAYLSLGSYTLKGAAGSWASAFYIGATGEVPVIGTNGATFQVTGFQLEVGSTATSFDFRSYGTELFMCQRYYQKFSGNSNVNATDGGINVMHIWDATAAYTGVILPTSMRSAPTLSYSALSDFTFFAYANTKTPTNIVYDGGNINRVEFYITWTGSLTAGYSGWLRINATAGWLAFSSEL